MTAGEVLAVGFWLALAGAAGLGLWGVYRRRKP
jgi:LPXTG-motif cell wall-anchored protein